MNAITTTPQTHAHAISRQRRADRKQSISDLFDCLYALEYGDNEKERWADEWEKQRITWLNRTPSESTRRCYDSSLNAWKIYLRERWAIDWLWWAEADHAAAWIQSMIEQGLAATSINRYVAGVSSYYNHVTSVTRLIEGVQVGLMVDSNGSPRANPLRNATVARPKVTAYTSAEAVPTNAMQWVLKQLDSKSKKTLANRRDYALLLLMYRTGYRADSTLRMKWGDLSNFDETGCIYRWVGKGGKIANKKLSSKLTNALIDYLKADGRYNPGGLNHIQDDDFIWKPIETTGGRLLGGRTKDEMLAENRHISQSAANETLRKHLRRYFFALFQPKFGTTAAKVEAEKAAKRLHLHSIRHTFARELEQASDGNVRLVSRTMDHNSIATTERYLERIKEPESEAIRLLEQEYGF